MVARQFETLADGLLFPEAPRWRDDRLWFSEKRAGRVVALREDGEVATSIDIDGEPGGLGWMPDGSMLVVSMARRTIVRIMGDAITDHADLSSLTTYRCNDMVVDRDGKCFVGDFGYDMAAGAAPAPGVLVLVPASGAGSKVVARDLHFPNGTIVGPDDGTLVIAESAANRLTAFTVEADGTLSSRRTWADLGDVVPDGICFDVEGAVWVADPLNDQVVRFAEHGDVLERIELPTGAFACELGGHDGHTLFVCTYDAAESASPTPRPIGQIVATRVEVPAPR